MMASHPPPQGEKDRKGKKITLYLCIGLVAVMTGLAYAAVPLYNLFCRVTGFAGTPQRATSEEARSQGSTSQGTVSEKGVERGDVSNMVTVQFDSNLGGGLPWSFYPLVKRQTVKLGEQTHMSYRAVNLSNRTIVGEATFNVSPPQVGPYFTKIQCFCFTEQTLKPGQSADFSVVYFVDPRIKDDKDLKSLTTITLSYTFYEKTP